MIFSLFRNLSYLGPQHYGPGWHREYLLHVSMVLTTICISISFVFLVLLVLFREARVIPRWEQTVLIFQIKSHYPLLDSTILLFFVPQ